ncbi:hypothetical protein J32TS6_38780 [Virgibacillus pantothenticus]|nr:hypothetical protein J32TS6_38780 [Virgibacillus pantothenticus]
MLLQKAYTSGDLADVFFQLPVVASAYVDIQQSQYGVIVALPSPFQKCTSFLFRYE